MSTHIISIEDNKCDSELDFFKIQNRKDGPQSDFKEKHLCLPLNMQMEGGKKRSETFMKLDFSIKGLLHHLSFALKWNSKGCICPLTLCQHRGDMIKSQT